MSDSAPIKKKVWIVDDDRSIRWVLDKALTHSGFSVKSFETASKALLTLKRVPVEDRPALILTDFRMPGISGFELLKQVKRIDALLPVIMMTAYSELDSPMQACEEGAFEYLAKPFDIDEAIARVSQACLQQPDTRAPSAERSLPVADWQSVLRQWALESLKNGDSDLWTTVIRDVEKILLESALSASGGRKLAAARLLGWGRNTLTRKLKNHR